MDSAAVTATTITITYSETPMVCPTNADANGDFVYNSSTGVSGGAVTGCSIVGGNVVLGGAFTLPGATGASIVYTAPATASAATAVSASNDFPQYPATQTLALAATTPPAIVAATWTSATTLTLAYSAAVTCPAGASSDFVYDSASATSGGAVTGCTSTLGVAPFTLTLTGAAFAAPTATASVIYTAPGSPSSTTAVFTTGTSVYAATQTVSLAVMVSAVVTPGASIAITYSVPVSCPTGAAALNGHVVFVYDSSISVAGGDVTGCTASGDVLTLTGAFNTAQGSASLVYTAPAVPTTVNTLFAGTSTNYVFPYTPQTLSGTAL
jgi:hypothetical protein